MRCAASQGRRGTCVTVVEMFLDPRQRAQTWIDGLIQTGMTGHSGLFPATGVRIKGWELILRWSRIHH